MMDQKKEEASKQQQQKSEENKDRVNVMDIEVNDDFEVDDIWHIYTYINI